MALKPVYPNPAPQLPAWASNSQNIKDFQNFASSRGYKFKQWDDIKSGKIPGYGNFGPQTVDAFSKHGGSFSPQLQRIGNTPKIAEAVKMSVRFPSTVPQIAGLKTGTAASGINIGGLKDLMPFASNIVNQFKSAPNPNVPRMLSPIQFKGVSYANERANVDSMVRGLDLGAERTLDGNASQAVKAANLATKLKAYGDIYTKETNQNSEINNKQAQINASIQASNNSAMDNYYDQRLQKKMVESRTRSENLANASDKFMAMQNEKSKYNTDVQVAKIQSRLTQGVNGNFQKWLKDNKVENSFKFGGRLKKAY